MGAKWYQLYWLKPIICGELLTTIINVCSSYYKIRNYSNAEVHMYTKIAVMFKHLI